MWLFKKKKILIIAFLSIILIVSLMLIGYKVVKRINLKNNILSDIVIEYGEVVTLNKILKSEKFENVIADPELTTLKEVGEYTVKIKLKDDWFDVKVTIKDTLPPNLEVQDITRYIDEETPTANDFILFSSDLSNYEIMPIEITKELGTFEVEIVLKDEYGNINKKTAKITFIEDKDPPVFSGLSDIVIEEGTKVDLQAGVLAIDARYGNVLYTVDDSKVYYHTPGTYAITYYAKDPLGNEAYGYRKITINKKPVIHLIENFPVYNQYPNYPNGCESIALYNLLRYYGINVTPEEIVENLKKGDGPYWDGDKLYGGNPEIEFVGDPRDIHGYGVYQKPIMEVANIYKSGIIDYSGHSLNEVLELVKSNIPVQVWVSINLVNTNVCTSWTYTPTGETINWICNLHSVVIVGYSEKSVFVSDSYTGKIEEYDRNQFEKMFNLFGQRSLYYPN